MRVQVRPRELSREDICRLRSASSCPETVRDSERSSFAEDGSSLLQKCRYSFSCRLGACDLSGSSVPYLQCVQESFCRGSLSYGPKGHRDGLPAHWLFSREGRIRNPELRDLDLA